MNNMSINWKVDEYLVRYIYISRFVTLLCNSCIVGGCAQLLLHNKQILRSSCVKKEKKDREYLQREVFCIAHTTSWHATQFQRKTKKERSHQWDPLQSIFLPPSLQTSSSSGRSAWFSGWKMLQCISSTLYIIPLNCKHKKNTKKKMRNTHMARG